MYKWSVYTCPVSGLVYIRISRNPWDYYIVREGDTPEWVIRAWLSVKNQFKAEPYRVSSPGLLQLLLDIDNIDSELQPLPEELVKVLTQNGLI